MSYDGQERMANQNHVELLRCDVDAWNEWRQVNAGVRPDLTRSDLNEADLVLADLSSAELAGANLTMANLRGADLRGADLSGANLLGARLLGVDLVGANLCGANLSTAEDLTEEQLEEALGDEQTVLPDDIQHPSHWARIRKVNVAEAFDSFSEYWFPRIVGDVGDMHVKAIKLLGDFVWHKHEEEDEFFFVVKGRMVVRFRDRDISVHEGEFIIVPRGTEHQTVAEQECHVLVVEPKSTVNTGNVTNDRTVTKLDRI